MRRVSSFLIAALSLVSCLCPALQAQDTLHVPNDRFGTDHFVPAIGPGNYLQVDGALVGQHLDPTLEAWIDYAYQPFVLFTAYCITADQCGVDETRRDIVEHKVTLNLAGTISLHKRVQLGLIVPLVMTQGDHFAISTPGYDRPYLEVPGDTAFGLGDPRLSIKLRLLGDGDSGLLLAAVLHGTLPLGHLLLDDRAIGYDGPTLGGHLVAEYRWSRLRVAFNAGGIYRPSRRLLSESVSSDIYYGAAGAYDITRMFSVLTELFGATRVSNLFDETPAEWRVAGRLNWGRFVVQLGAGLGLVTRVGFPDFRALASVAYQPPSIDTDGDGVMDVDDACPTQPEDLDGYQDADGCPDDDNDADKFPDTQDKCPNEPEDFDGFEDEDGCPDRDNDADGIPDGYDSCPMEQEDMDGDRDTDGCPDNDRDRDGVPDDKDKCPDQAEDTDGLGDEDGCPEDDFDSDGIPDAQDLCPDKAETQTNKRYADGCPG